VPELIPLLRLCARATSSVNHDRLAPEGAHSR
jgi:hypothetical protein